MSDIESQANTNANTPPAPRDLRAAPPAQAQAQAQPPARQPYRFDERTPLLSPDDPAVTPMNRLSVRILRSTNSVLIVLGLLYWLAVLISTFISFPLLYSATSPFRTLLWSTLTVLTLTVSAMFFAVPSQVERGVSVTALILIVAVWLTVAFRVPLRSTQLVIAVATTVCATAFSLLADYIVDKAKTKEEVRLTGRPEPRRTCTEWGQLSLRLILRAGLLFLVALGALTTFVDLYDSTLPPWGTNVALQAAGAGRRRFRMHVACHGLKDSNSTLLLFPGETSAEELASWAEDLYHSGKVPSYCVWDYPGVAFSQNAPSPLPMGAVAEYLYTALGEIGALSNASEIEVAQQTENAIQTGRMAKAEPQQVSENVHLKPDAPSEPQVISAAQTGRQFTLVGHGMGGLYARVFASMYPTDTFALLYIDPFHPDILTGTVTATSRAGDRIPRASRKFPVHGLTAREGFRQWLLGITSTLGLQKLRAIRWITGGWGKEDRVWGRGWDTSPEYHFFKLQEQLSSGVSYSEVKVADATVARVPSGVVSSGQMIDYSKVWGAWQRSIAQTGSCVRWVVSKAGHNVWESAAGVRDLQDVLDELLNG